jgi:hypothetical protein
MRASKIQELDLGMKSAASGVADIVADMMSLDERRRTTTEAKTVVCIKDAHSEHGTAKSKMAV